MELGRRRFDWRAAGMLTCALRCSMKGTIPWSDRLSTELKSAKHFLVHVPGRSYRLEAVADTAESWVTSLKAVQQAVQSSGDGSKSK